MTWIRFRTQEMRLTFIISVGAVVVSCGGGGGTSSAPELPPPPVNVAPIVEAGSDLTVGEQTKVLDPNLWNRR
jgi:hypothetical protein